MYALKDFNEEIAQVIVFLESESPFIPTFPKLSLRRDVYISFENLGASNS